MTVYRKEVLNNHDVYDKPLKAGDEMPETGVNEGADIMNERIRLICPVCGSPLLSEDKSYVCSQRHRFDRARQGYVNLLPVQSKHSLHPGDTKEMLLARRRFLDSGLYEPVCRSVTEAFQTYLSEPCPLIADIGCGEGYYTALIKEICGADCIGVDIAKEGVRMACSRDKSILWLVATASHLPLADASLDGLSAMFSLFLPQEYARVLKKGGCVAEVTVGSDHLRELKEIIYESVFEQHKHPSPCGPLFEEVMCQEQRYQITLNRQQLQDLLLMTPHFWRIKEERRERLMQTEALRLTVNYFIRVLTKK